MPSYNIFKKGVYIIRDPVLYGILFFGIFCNAFPQNTVITDSVTNRTGSFYRTDSLFSFTSQKGYVPSLAHNILEQAAEPFMFSRKEWLITGGIVATTAVLIIADDKIDHWARIQKDEHQWVNKVSPVVTEFGGSRGVYAVCAAGLLSAAFNKEKGVQTCLLATQAMITSGLWVQVLKQLTGRERPKASYIFSGIDGGKWHGPFEKNIGGYVDDRSHFSYDAFPSGHTASAFSIATVFATQYSDTKVIPIICYSAATLTGLSRMTEHEHWASDVFLGAVFGYVCGKHIVRHFYELHGTSLSESKAQSKPVPQYTFFREGDQFGLIVTW